LTLPELGATFRGWSFLRKKRLFPLPEFLKHFGSHLAQLSTLKKSVLAFACTVFLVELAFRRFGRGSKAYVAWTRFFEGIGKVWTAVILSVVYLLSVGPIGLVMRLRGRDLLDRTLAPEASFWRAHEPNPLGPKAAARHQF
jgi:Saxitoxin biosynthesis operon protein SxtJ